MLDEGVVAEAAGHRPVPDHRRRLALPPGRHHAVPGPRGRLGAGERQAVPGAGRRERPGVGTPRRHRAPGGPTGSAWRRASSRRCHRVRCHSPTRGPGAQGQTPRSSRLLTRHQQPAVRRERGQHHQPAPVQGQRRVLGAGVARGRPPHPRRLVLAPDARRRPADGRRRRGAPVRCSRGRPPERAAPRPGRCPSPRPAARGRAVGPRRRPHRCGVAPVVGEAAGAAFHRDAESGRASAGMSSARSGRRRAPAGTSAA